MGWFSDRGQLFSQTRIITMHFLCTGVISSKLSQPIIQRKNGKISAHFNWKEDYDTHGQSWATLPDYRYNMLYHTGTVGFAKKRILYEFVFIHR
jgi:hypothetical protein